MEQFKENQTKRKLEKILFHSVVLEKEDCQFEIKNQSKLTNF